MSSKLSKDKARQIIETLASYSKNHAFVSIHDNGERLTRYANSEIHQNVEVDDTIVRLTLWAGKKSATCRTNVFDEESLKKLAADTEAMLAHAPEGEYEQPPLAPPYSDDVPETPNDNRLGQKFDIKGRAEAVKGCVKSLGPDYTASGVLSLDRQVSALGDSSGLFRYYAFDSVNFEAVVTHKDGETGFGAVETNNLDNCDIDGAFKIAYEKAKSASKAPPAFADLGAYTVVLEPAAVADLLRFMLIGLNGSRCQKGLSFASGLLGQKVFGENLTIRDDVNNKATFQRFFDAEGYPRKPLTLVEKGVIKNIVHCSKTAKEAGVNPTGHSIGSSGDGGFPLNVIMEGGTSSLPEMIAGVKKGILVTHFHYCNFVNPKTLQVTGLTRDGTFMIENGAVTTALRNMRFTESLLNAFSNIRALSKELSPVGFFGGPALMPAAVIEDFHFTSGQK